MPKSSTLTKSSSSLRLTSMTLAGLRSRWMTSAACAASSARAICAAISSARSTGSGPSRVDQLLEVRPVEVLHHEVEGAVGGRARVGDVDDVGVADLRGRARLAPEALDQLGAGVEARVQDLDRDAPADVDVVRLVDAAHRPFAAQPAQVVAAAQRRADARILAGRGPSRASDGPSARREPRAAGAAAGAAGVRRRRAPASAPAAPVRRSRPTAGPSPAAISACALAPLGRACRRRTAAAGTRPAAAASVLGAVSARNAARSARSASPSGSGPRARARAPASRCGRARAARAASASTAAARAGRARAGARRRSPRGGAARPDRARPGTAGGRSAAPRAGCRPRRGRCARRAARAAPARAPGS